MSGLSIVVVSWNTRDLTRKCVALAARALADFAREVGEPVQLVVVDNGSTDGTAKAVREEAPNAELVALPGNRGFAGGANAGAAVARGEILLFLNTDVRLDAETLKAAWRHLAACPGTAIAAPQLLHPDGRLQHSAHAFPGLLDEWVPGWLIDGIRPRRRPAKRRVGDAPTPVEAVQGAAMFVRARVFAALGGFCEDYFFYLEETDLCWRAREAGHGVDLLPGTSVVHAAGSSSKRVAAAASRIEYHRSLYRFLEERRGPATRRLAVALRIGRGLVTVVALGLASPFSAPARSRLGERLALLRWHLGGRPASSGLAGLEGPGTVRAG